MGKVWTDEEPAVTVVIPSGHQPRYHTFELSLTQLRLPKDSGQHRAVSSSICLNLNSALRNVTTPYYFFVDDDHEFESYVVLALMKHRLPFVSALSCLAKPHFDPVVFSGETPPDDKGHTQHTAYTWADLDGKRGLFEAYAVGRTGWLVHRSLLDKIGDPWFIYGHFNPEHPGEDFYFCKRVRETGCKVMVDLDVRLGHTGPATVTPVQLDDGTWSVCLTWMGVPARIVINQPPRASSPTE